MNGLREHLGNPYFAIHKRDQLFVCYFLGFGLFSFCYTAIVVLPYNYGEVSNFHHFLLSFLYFGIYLNFYKMIANSSHLSNRTRREQTALDEVKIERDFDEDRRKEVAEDKESICKVCRITRPVRSFHCKRCNVCVKKRDHHCTLNGSCVGSANQRFYFSMALYVALTATYFNVHHLPLIYRELIKHNTFTIPFCFLAPHFLFFFGIISLYEFLACLITLKAMAVLFFSYAVTLHQLLLMIRGQTRYEMKVKVHSFNRGIVDNLKSVLGQRWYLAWASPVVPSPLPKDDPIFDEYSKLV